MKLNASVQTVEQIRNLVPPEYRERYETQYSNKIGEFYKRVADLRNLVLQTQWGRDLEIGFKQNYFAFYSCPKRRLFGVHLYGTPRFCVWITQAEAERFIGECEFEIYYSGNGAFYPSDTNVDVLLPILEFAYKKHTGP